MDRAVSIMQSLWSWLMPWLNREDSYRQIVEMSPDAIVIERDEKIIFANNGALKLMGASESRQVLGRAMLDFIAVEEHERVQEHVQKLLAYEQEMQPFESKIVRLGGTTVDVEMSQAVFQYAGALAIQTVAHDISKRKKYEEQLREQALHDVLTGLPNRALLIEHLRQTMAIAERQKHAVYVLFFDLDRFKYVNDTLGHDAGDELLKTITRRILECVRKCDTLARLGGDEFVLILGGVTDQERMAAFIQRIMNRISEPMMLGGEEVTVTCSVGLSVYPHDAKEVSALLKYADTAMYRAKEQGRNQLQHYCAVMHTQINERLAMESRLRRALEREEFLLYYQPLLDLNSGKIMGAEALLRWQHPELDMVPPSRFISLAEETGLIVGIGKWVLRTACAQARRWQMEGLPLHRISVNLSAQQLLRSDLEIDIQQALQDSGLAPECLELEITESMSMADPERTIELLKRLKTMGVSIAIDDFGTGYSNLVYLKRFPVDRLKIDRSFVRDITRDPNDSMLTHAMITMAHNLNLTVVAEGVEEPGQLTELAAHGCDEIQGYYFSPPVPPHEFAQMLVEGRSLYSMATETRVVYPGPESADDTRYNDLIEILKTALEKTTAEYGAYTLEPSIKMTEARLMSELELGSTVNVAWSSTSVEKESKFLPIRIPLRKGLLGYRVAIIDQAKQEMLDQVKTLDDFKKLTIGQGIGWGDVKIYEDAGFNVTTASYPNLFKMVASGCFDLFPRGIVEAPLELEHHTSDNPNLTIEKNLVIYYPWPYYFFFNKRDEVLAMRIEKGVLEMIKDGSFDELFRRYNIDYIKQALYIIVQFNTQC